MHGRCPFLGVLVAANGGSEGPAFTGWNALGEPNVNRFIYNGLVRF
jgi:hypothetical protein